MRLQNLFLIAFLAVSCQSDSYRIALEGRLERGYSAESSFEPGDDPIGASVAIVSIPVQGAEYPIGWELGYGEGNDSFGIAGGEYELQHRETWAGVNYSFLDGHWRPYLGAGVQFSQQSVDLTFGGSELKQDTDDWGPYLEAGLRLRFNLANHFVMGYRRTMGLEGNIGALDVDLDYAQVFLGFGYSF